MHSFAALLTWRVMKQQSKEGSKISFFRVRFQIKQSIKLFFFFKKKEQLKNKKKSHNQWQQQEYFALNHQHDRILTMSFCY